MILNNFYKFNLTLLKISGNIEKILEKIYIQYIRNLNNNLNFVV